jgi:hypothetical protein
VPQTSGEMEREAIGSFRKSDLEVTISVERWYRESYMVSVIRNRRHILEPGSRYLCLCVKGDHATAVAFPQTERELEALEKQWNVCKVCLKAAQKHLVSK